jgi:hypothetical protein
VNETIVFNVLVQKQCSLANCGKMLQVQNTTPKYETPRTSVLSLQSLFMLVSVVLLTRAKKAPVRTWHGHYPGVQQCSAVGYPASWILSDHKGTIPTFAWRA